MSDWRDRAVCRGLYNLMFPGRGENHDVTAAKALCAICPVRSECLEHAMAESEMVGIWGGLSERERRRLRAERAKRIGHAVLAERNQAAEQPVARRVIETSKAKRGSSSDMPPWMVERIERLRRREAALAVPDDEAMAV